MAAQYRYPFGRPVQPFPRPDRGRRAVFVLGAYPSALHVEWTSPSGEHVNALPIDDEPEPFWNGTGECDLVDSFRSTRRPVGEVRPAGLTWNGTSGVALDDRYLTPLSYKREDAWITDCLETYFASESVAKAIARAYEPVAQTHELEDASLPAHPNEARIVQGACQAERLNALRSELRDAGPSVVVTLGNAALRVLRTMLTTTVGPAKITAEKYGHAVDLDLGGSARWYPLAHPGATRKGRPYHDIHEAWIESVGRNGA